MGQTKEDARIHIPGQYLFDMAILTAMFPKLSRRIL